jgi:CBS domain-containing protein
MAIDHRATVDLPIRSRRTYDADGEVEQHDTVFCPARGLSLDTATCLDCRHCLGASASAEPALVCMHPAARPTNDRRLRPVRMPSPAELTALSEIMTRDVACVAADLSIEALGTLMLTQAISAVPVVDTTGRPIGIASKTDLVRWYHDGGEDETAAPTDGAELGMSTRTVPIASVADLMMPMAFTLTEDAPVAYAAALMAVEDVHHLPIVASDGRVVGIVSALDIVRWLAHHDGFVVPPAR